MEVKEPSAKYLARPRYKQTEVGTIPEDWQVVTLLDLAGGSKERFDDGDWIEAEFLTESGIRLVQTGNIGVGVFVEKNSRKYISAASFELLRCKALNEGDLLICRLADPAGRTCLFPKLEDNKAITAVDVTIFRPIDELANRRYLLQLFGTRSWFVAVNERCGGSTRTRIARGALGKIPIPLPPTKREQENIARALTDADALIESLEQLLAKKRQIKQGAMQELLTGKRRLPGFRIKQGYKQTEVGVIPEDWEVTSVGDEFSIQLGKMLDSEKNIGLPKPFLGNRAVQWGAIDLSDIGLVKLTPSDLHRFRLQEGDLLVCEGGEVGRAAIWQQPIVECYYQKALHRLRPKRGYNVTLMLNVLRRLSSTGFLLNFVTQTSIAHLPKDKFKTVPIPRPSNAEQTAIAASLSDMDAEISALDDKLDKARQAKRGMMQQLLTGRIRLAGSER